MKRVVLIICFLNLLVLSVSAQTKSELEKRKSSALKEINLAKELLKKTTSEKNYSISSLAIINRSISSRQRYISDLNDEISNIEKEIHILEIDISKITADINKGKDEYAKLVYSVYKNHTDEDKMMYLLASSSLNQFYQRIKYLTYLKNYRENKVRELEYLVLELEEKKLSLTRIKNEHETLISEKEKESKGLIEERSSKNRMINKLLKEEAKIKQEIREKEKVRRELEDEIRKIIEEEIKRSSTSDRFANLTPEQILEGKGFSENKGKLPWPVERGVITSKYGLIPHENLKGVKIYNPGVDISSIPGQKVRAIYDGVVTNILAIKGANYAIMVMHGEYRTIYQNIIDLQVKVGDKVSTKQELGTIFVDKHSNISELHIQVWKDKNNLNPTDWLSK